MKTLRRIIFRIFNLREVKRPKNLLDILELAISTHGVYEDWAYEEGIGEYPIDAFDARIAAQAVIVELIKLNILPNDEKI